MVCFNILVAEHIENIFWQNRKMAKKKRNKKEIEKEIL